MLLGACSFLVFVGLFTLSTPDSGNSLDVVIISYREFFVAFLLNLLMPILIVLQNSELGKYAKNRLGDFNQNVNEIFANNF